MEVFFIVRGIERFVVEKIVLGRDPYRGRAVVRRGMRYLVVDEMLSAIRRRYSYHFLERIHHLRVRRKAYLLGYLRYREIRVPQKLQALRYSHGTYELHDRLSRYLLELRGQVRLMIAYRLRDLFKRYLLIEMVFDIHVYLSREIRVIVLEQQQVLGYFVEKGQQSQSDRTGVLQTFRLFRQQKDQVPHSRIHVAQIRNDHIPPLIVRELGQLRFRKQRVIVDGEHRIHVERVIFVG